MALFITYTDIVNDYYCCVDCEPTIIVITYKIVKLPAMSKCAVRPVKTDAEHLL